jgi:hypothetical protein
VGLTGLLQTDKSTVAHAIGVGVLKKEDFASVLGGAQTILEEQPSRLTRHALIMQIQVLANQMCTAGCRLLSPAASCCRLLLPAVTCGLFAAACCRLMGERFQGHEMPW